MSAGNRLTTGRNRKHGVLQGKEDAIVNILMVEDDADSGRLLI